ncbi:hypothetical protein A2U01_0083483, partial [Trifolium medium]|nr:hypothetical protein [Trifolium medium]
MSGAALRTTNWSRFGAGIDVRAFGFGGHFGLLYFGSPEVQISAVLLLFSGECVGFLFRGGDDVGSGAKSLTGP